MSDNFDTLRAAGGIMWREYGAWAYDTWAAHNTAYFGGELAPPGIIWALPPDTQPLTHYDAQYGVITLHSGLLESERANLWGLDAWAGQQIASDALLHAMIHQRLGLGECSLSSHNDSRWVDEVNRIAPLVRLRANARVIPQLRKGQSLIWAVQEGSMRRQELGCWPLLSRPEGFYGAATWERFGARLRGG